MESTGGVALLVAASLSLSLHTPPVAGQVAESCLACICEAASSCDTNAGCNGDVCGPFKITWAFWADAGKPVLQQDSPDSDGAYVRCVSDVYCAASAVEKYMVKYAKDCNGNGQVDCFDLAAIHRLGVNACGGALDYAYQSRFTQCQQQVAQLTNQA